MTLSYVPIFLVDVFGSVLMIVLSLFCLFKALLIRDHDRENVIWIYLVWVCYGMVIFAVSRSAGHIIKQFLMMHGFNSWWDVIRPYSGSVNTLAFVLVASITLFFRQIWKIYQQIVRDKHALQGAHEELVALNQNLEKRVEKRSRELAQESEQRMILEKHMAQTEKLAAIGELSAGVAHEINNPLGIILGYSQLLIRNEPEDDGRVDDLKTIEKHVKHCQRIVADLLSFSRSAGSEKKSGNVHDILNEVLDFMEKHTNFNHVTVNREYDPDLPMIFMDREKIKQVFINLLMNAKYAMDARGTLRLTTRFVKADKMVDIHIVDDGVGIEENDITRIFEPFFTTKPTGQGTGLGLSVTYGIIRDHGGDITVQSQKGKGTTFVITLPINNKANNEK